MKLNNLHLWFFSLLILTSCGKSPTDVRKELAQLNIPFDKEACLEYTQKQDKVVIDLFLALDISPECILIGASETGDIELVKQALSEGANPNLMLDNELRELENSQALCKAANRGHTEIVELLLSKGAIPNSDYLSSSCQELARRKGHTEIAQLLQKETLEIARQNEKKLVGLWSGYENRDTSEEKVDSYWEVTRNDDGTFTRKGVHIDHKTREYHPYSMTGRWNIDKPIYYEEEIESYNNKPKQKNVPSIKFTVRTLEDDEFEYWLRERPGNPGIFALEEKINTSKPLPVMPDGYVEVE